MEQVGRENPRLQIKPSAAKGSQDGVMKTDSVGTGTEHRQCRAASVVSHEITSKYRQQKRKDGRSQHQHKHTFKS